MSRTRTFRTANIALLLGFVCVFGLTGCAGPRVDARADEVLVPMVNKLAGTDQLTMRGYRTLDPASELAVDMPESAEVTAMVGAADRMAVHAEGDGFERRTYYDGETFTVYDVAKNVYGSVPAPATIDELLAMLDEEYGFRPPMADFIINDPWRYLTDGAKTVTYVDREYVSRYECHRLAIARKKETVDLWVSVVDELPVRLAITKAGADKPCLAIDVAEIDLDVEHPDEVFEFVPPEGARKVEGLPL